MTVRRSVRVVGIGPGGVDDLTVAAVKALNEVAAVIVLDKDRGVDDLNTIRRMICAWHITGPYREIEVADPPRDRHPEDYVGEVEDWHDARAARLERTLVENVADGESVAILVWGDPSLYDSTIRVLEKVRARGAVDIDYDVVPGVSALGMLAARHRLVLNRIGGPITVTTGRRLTRDIAGGADNVVVFLDGKLACRELHGDWRIWWGANLGTHSEKLVHGKLADVVEDVERLRDAAKAERGWVMDVYLLRRDSADGAS